MDLNEKAVLKHKEWQGKIEVISRTPVTNKEELSLAYTPGVAAPCLEIEKDPELSYELTRRGNLVAVITDGTAVLGLGDIGPLAAMPVMEGKCCLFKEFAGVDAIPLCVNSKSVEEIVRTIELIGLSFGGINLEDISAPRCFEIERQLKEKLNIPVFHDDQHGTAIVVGAALINSSRLTGKPLEEMTVVVNGAGAAGIAIAKFLMLLKVGNIIMCDKDGILYRGAPYMNEAQEKMAQITNRDNKTGLLADAMEGADVFVGVSRPGLLTAEMIQSMNEKPIVFAMANPVPEIMPDEAKAAGAYIVGTGRSDFPNQINNVLAFPGIFKGALQARATDITDEMKLSAAYGIASIIPQEELAPEYILPDPFHKQVAANVAKAVADAVK
ncbi:NADP-dependent malic enzyme [uncultured Ruminococcus sp.]|uniref:NAD-dependent malic enzyme n=1 Tax=Massiliimalia timonensis TaxID=1987501 RepID=A0A8J6P9N5_9FIRM|nr:malic enzyme-like NAD(P)-binding protein [Massiliimalia timonensis]MBC8611864.1 NAD-dependent malic enzyme [Massiliimalia timonensis]MBS7175749.1 NAD-dependent malic enzyme [Clostridiales bacterium]SCH54992.1 NADP-dependent malic enzyme [uncultured Clostridium sp.]SCH66305.1 NADP-dependent malic enzyme [uncultured Ruminococcus sp.]